MASEQFIKKGVATVKRWVQEVGADYPRVNVVDATDRYARLLMRTDENLLARAAVEEVFIELEFNA